MVVVWPLTLQHHDGLRAIGVDVGRHLGALVQLKDGQGDGTGVEEGARTLQAAALDAAASKGLRCKVWCIN
jgi:hypothetical protein